MVKTVVNTCTVGVPLVEEMEKALKAKGIGLVDCPISGGPPGARAGTLAVMVSGEPALVEKIKPIVSCWGPVTVAGPKAGSAQILEAHQQHPLRRLARRHLRGVRHGRQGWPRSGGDDPRPSTPAGPQQRDAVDVPRVRARLATSTTAPRMHILIKDVDLAIEQGERLGIPMWVCQAARLMYKHAMFVGMQDKDITELVRVVESGAGFELPKTR